MRLIMITNVNYLPQHLSTSAEKMGYEIYIGGSQSLIRYFAVWIIGLPAFVPYRASQS